MASRMRWCAPHCKVPDKRDFMDVQPERSNEDFFRNYDPMVGIGTAAILAVFILLITIKSFIKWTARKIRMFRYEHRSNPKADFEAAAAHIAAVSVPAVNGNGHIST
ncbi:hypothetical protein Tcan_07436 [Toxocara canis]|uniref:Uncharacterized protein n=2 Tax=Toxocara canis TaxID=6265 RepID=A0A0B2W1N3_TOXCA|nr:hypothetical protein Tcan_07436 [Toxocara canis]VDM39351.1 unnamed protein product [Toxocara canis]